MSQLRILAVDDSLAFRRFLADVVNDTGVARVVAHAADGKKGIEQLAEVKPDVVTLDVEMPGLSGLHTLALIKAQYPSLPVIMISSAGKGSAAQTMEALERGAYDFVAKPEGPDVETNRKVLGAALRELFAAIASEKQGATPKPSGRTPPGPAAASFAPPSIVGIGASTGGPAALAKVIPKLPANLSVPVVVVQHMPPVFTASLAESLRAKSAVRVVEAADGMRLDPGTVYIAPGGKHLRVVAGEPRGHVELTMDAPEHFCRPAVDYTFRSLAAAYRERVLGVILTGMGKDGTLGLKAMKRSPVKVIGQSEGSCTVYGMPREAMIAGVVDIELPAEQIAAEIVASLSGRGASK